jgi:DNA-binding PadR family transcriptional regulator
MSTTLHQLKKGVTTLIVLDALEKGTLYGYGLRREVHERTRCTLQFSEGALYPLLHSLERKGFVKASRRKIGGRWRHYYKLTSRGHRALADLRREWNFLLDSLKSIFARQRKG